MWRKLLLVLAFVVTACTSSSEADPYGLGYSHNEFETWLQERDIETWLSDNGVLAGQTWDGNAMVEITGPADNVRTVRLRFGPDATEQEFQILEDVLAWTTREVFSSLSELVDQISPDLPYKTSEFTMYTDKFRVLVERSVETDRIQVTVTRK